MILHPVRAFKGEPEQAAVAKDTKILDTYVASAANTGI